MPKTERWIKLGGVVICEIFTLITIIMLWAGSEPDRLALAFGTLLLVLLPMLLENLGAIITCVILWVDKGRHSLIR